MEKGTIFKFHNDLDTDQIIASQYLLLPNLEEMKSHAFESLDPDFAQKVKPGDFVVGGENFGCGSSREQAPEIIKALGIQCVIAKSFARIFFRNFSLIVPDFYFPGITGSRLQRLSLISHMLGHICCHFSGIPDYLSSLILYL